MKQNHLSQVRGQTATKVLLTLGAAAIAPVIALAGTETPAPAAAEPSDQTNEIGLTVGGISIGGNHAAFQHRQGYNGDFFVGIDSFHLQQKIGKDTTATLDGHAMFGLEDYEFKAAIENDKMGFFRAGYRQFRSWSELNGGYYGLGAVNWVTPSRDASAVDRGDLFFEAGLRVEDVPEITVSYHHLFRDGVKDSTSWGEAVGLTSGYRIAPAALSLDEERNIFQFDIKHTLGNTDFGGGLRYENDKIADRRFTERGTTTAADRTFIQTQGYQADLYTGHLFSETRFSDKLWLTAGYVLTSMNTNNDGSSRTVNPILTGSSYARDYRFNEMAGGAEVTQQVANLSLMWTPIEDLTVVPCVRAEHESIDNWAGYQAYPNPRLSTSTNWFGPQAEFSADHISDLKESLEMRYTGIRDIVLFARGELTQTDESGWAQDILRPTEKRLTDSLVDEKQYTVGANWYPVSGLSFALEGIHDERDQSFDHYLSNGGTAVNNNLTPLMINHDSTTDNLSLRMTWRPVNNLSLVTRYDYREMDINNQGLRWDLGSTTLNSPVLLAPVESGRINSHMISESITFSPTNRLYFQGNLSYMMDETDTPAQYATSVKNLVPQSDNDYFNGSLSIGYLIDDKTDLQASYNYCSGSNLVNNSPLALPFGSNLQEHVFSLTLTRWLSKSMVWNLRYAYMKGSDDAVAGLNDYNAQVISTGLKYRF